MPSGQVWVRRPPRDTRTALSRMMAQAPSEANLLALRAREAEQRLDFEAAEADRKKYAELASDYLALADFYQRCLRPADEILDRARSGSDLQSAARIFYYYQQQGNLAATGRALAEYRLRKEPGQEAWRAEELLTLGRLSEGIHDYNEAARCYYALYSVPGGDTQEALAGLIGVLLASPRAADPVMRPRAVDVLVRAAGALHPDLQRQFALEAANKAAESGE